MRIPRSLAVACLLFAAVRPAAAQTYILATPDIYLNSDLWALGASNMSEFRSAITNPTYFGNGGTVPVSITIQELSTITAPNLAAADGFFVPWWNITQSAAHQSTVIAAFHAGMDLWLLEDDAQHNGIGTALGISSSQAAGTPSNGTAPFFSGPFGTATNTNTYGNFFQFNETAVLSLNGTVIGRNGANEVTAAYWPRGAFSANSGALILFSDVDMISNWNGVQHYQPTLSANGILALNTMAALVQPVPEPGTYALMGAGLLVVAWRRWRRTET